MTMQLLNYDEILNLPRYKPLENCGVYFLFLKNEIVYIGSSIDVYVRVHSHIKEKEFDSFAFINTAPEDKLYFEELYLEKFLPKDNKAFAGKKYRSEDWFRKRLKTCGRWDITNNFKRLLKEKNTIRHPKQVNLISVDDFKNKFNIDIYSIILNK